MSRTQFISVMKPKTNVYWFVVFVVKEKRNVSSWAEPNLLIDEKQMYLV